MSIKSVLEGVDTRRTDDLFRQAVPGIHDAVAEAIESNVLVTLWFVQLETVARCACVRRPCQNWSGSVWMIDVVHDFVGLDHVAPQSVKG